ncbi:MAG TPA: dTDP-4-amino-4,6-dideoxygalactose transaminase, partial [Gammaproteobacteria bacterium]|nr:dTDP-4-amino-4,6-dideoxygalactose transaminase [Gammaproteobacteria bacterium]
CHAWLETHTGCESALLTHSCTAALEMAALLMDIQPGDEIIMPSFTFVSTANAFALRGGIPVFVDIREDTLNIDETKIEAAITPLTRAIVPVHYAGVSCEMDAIMDIACRHNLLVAEDAAQGILSTYKGRPLGSIGELGTLSFHETKNVISGEGGALLINKQELVLPAEIIREKGTNRSQFQRGSIDKYTWQALGSSYLTGEITAAFLAAQLERAEWITQNRLDSWLLYQQTLESLEAAGHLRRPSIPEHCVHNAHMYYIVLADHTSRDALLARLNNAGINAVFHYVPLHTSPAGQQFARLGSEMNITEAMAPRLIRLPLWVGMTAEEIGRVCKALASSL